MPGACVHPRTRPPVCLRRAEAVASLDWRSYAATRGLSDKQQKLADRVRKREAKVQSLQREVDKIKASL